jgi:hypothetical protein
VNLGDGWNDRFGGTFVRTGVDFSLGAVGICARVIFSTIVLALRRAPMAKLCGGGFLRIVVAFALVSFAFLFGSVGPLLRAAPIGGPVVKDRTSAVSVNRYRKGDRLPVSSNSDKPNRAGAKGATWWDLREQGSSQSRRQVPIGCDPAFSPVSSPSLARVFGRCMT